MKRRKDQNMRDLGEAGTNNNVAENDNGFPNHANNPIKDLLFLGKKPNEVMEEDHTDVPTDLNDIMGWYGGHSVIGKMQNNILDGVADITGDDGPDLLNDEDPLMIPTPKGFEPDCLDDTTILFLNTSILLDLRREWRFLHSTKTHGSDFDTFFGAIEYQGPTILVMTTPNSAMVGVFTSTSWP